MRVFKCFDDGCTQVGSDWTDRADAWQWGVVLPLGLGMLVAAFLLAGCLSVVFVRRDVGKRIARWRIAVLLVAPLIIEVVLVASFWMLVASTRRDDLKEQLAWLTMLLVTTGALSVSSAWRLAR